MVVSSPSCNSNKIVIIIVSFARTKEFLIIYSYFLKCNINNWQKIMIIQKSSIHSNIHFDEKFKYLARYFFS